MGLIPSLRSCLSLWEWSLSKFILYFLAQLVFTSSDWIGLISEEITHHSISSFYFMVFPGGSAVKSPPAAQEMQETRVWSLGQEDPLEEGKATHFSILAGRITWIEEPGGLQSMGSWRVRHEWSYLACTHAQSLNPFSLKKCVPVIIVFLNGNGEVGEGDGMRSKRE